MIRTYTLRRRAERQAQTRQRIIEAAVDLHGSVGPARTSISMVARRAGVQRHTVYAHFPDERDLYLACSALTLERDPLPQAEPWRHIRDCDARLRAGRCAVYGWYGRNAALAACVLRDAGFHALTREVVEQRMGPPMRAYRRILGTGLHSRQRAVLRLALSFFTWRTLVCEAGLPTGAAIGAMVGAIDHAR